MHTRVHIHNQDPVAIAAAALDALCADDADALGFLLRTHEWIWSEVVYADAKTAVQDRESKGWSAERAAAIPVIQIALLERQGLQASSWQQPHHCH